MTRHLLASLLFLSWTASVAPLDLPSTGPSSSGYQLAAAIPGMIVPDNLKHSMILLRLKAGAPASR